MGATTIWERWNSILPDGQFSDVSMNSLNHYAYGSIVEWMYRNALGINPAELTPDGRPAQGFKHALLAPMPHNRLAWAKGEYMSAMGMFKSAWRINDDGSLTLTATVPFNATAEWVLPDVPEGELPCNGAARSADGTVTVSLEPGEHTVTYTPTAPYIPRYDMDSTLGELAANPEIKSFLCDLEPRL
jgi:alpha-L-rhamnosidase